MSLDVYLYDQEDELTTHWCSCGNEHQLRERRQLFSANITHNLGRMASEAGIYEALWRPDEHGITKAKQVGDAIEKGLVLMRADPLRFWALEAANGWGKFDDFVPWLENYLRACREHPEALVEVSR